MLKQSRLLVSSPVLMSTEISVQAGCSSGRLCIVGVGFLKQDDNCFVECAN
jgi:hypothetical protein